MDVFFNEGRKAGRGIRHALALTFVHVLLLNKQYCAYFGRSLPPVVSIQVPRAILMDTNMGDLATIAQAEPACDRCVGRCSSYIYIYISFIDVQMQVDVCLTGCSSGRFVQVG